MKYYIIEPEVAGGLGEKSKILYKNDKIENVTYLDYEFQGWTGDDILTTHPCFIVSKRLSETIKKSSLHGYKLESISISFSEEYIELKKDCKIPDFMRIVPLNCVDDTKTMKILGEDFYLYNKRYLVVSEKALLIIKHFNIENSTIYEVDNI